MDWALTLSGFVVGALVGLTGVGGGALMTPMLVVGFGIPPLVAVGTDLVFAALTKSVGVWAHALRASVDWRIVGFMALGSLPAALATTFLLHRWQGAGVQVDAWVEGALGVALLATAAALVWGRRLRAGTETPRATPPWRWAATTLAGALLGGLVTLTSVGAGALGVVVLALLFPGLATTRLVATDLAHAVPLAALAGFGHWQLGHVDWGLLAVLLLGSLPGIYLGARLAHTLPERVTRPVLAVLLCGIGIKLIA